MIFAGRLLIMHVEKKYSINAPRSEVWKITSDPGGLSQCFPGIKSFEEKDPKHFVAKVGTPFTFLKGTISMDLEVISLENYVAQLRIQGKSLGSTFEILTEIILEEDQTSTDLTWVADMKPGGLLTAIPETVSRGAAVQLADRIFSCVEQKIVSGN